MKITNTHSEVAPAAITALPGNYDLLANLFLYPDNEDYRKKMAEIDVYLRKTIPEAAWILESFIGFVQQSSVRELQELYLRSFDVQAVTTLDIGFILFGEDYKRGKLLVHLNEEHRKANNDCKTELADHLPNLLRLLPRIEDMEMQYELATLLLLPALEKMIEEFTTDKIEKKDRVYKKHQKVLLDFPPNHRTIYRSCLECVFFVLKRDFHYTTEATDEVSSVNFDHSNPAAYTGNKNADDFSKNIETEMLTEK